MYAKTLVAILLGLSLTIWENNALPSKTHIINEVKGQVIQSSKRIEVSKDTQPNINGSKRHVGQSSKKTEVLKDLKPAIFGGNYVTDGEIPYQVALWIDDGSTISFCGGSILNPNWILTAAHCVEDPTWKVSNIMVLAGTANIEKKGVTRSVIQTVVYPNYNLANSAINDIALLKLNESLPFGRNIMAVRLPERGTPVEGTECLVSGWGLVEEYRRVPQLKSVVTKTISFEECFRSYENIIQSTNLCTRDDINTAICYGDSGSPLVDYESYIEGEPIQIGISSAGSISGCGSGAPDIFVKVSSYLRFINRYINN